MDPKRKADIMEAFKEMHRRYGTPITRFCPGCGCRVSHYGPITEHVDPCQLCRIFGRKPR